jgi:hypothetical protein
MRFAGKIEMVVNANTWWRKLEPEDKIKIYIGNSEEGTQK